MVAAVLVLAAWQGPRLDAQPVSATGAAATRIARQCNICHGDRFQSLARDPHAVLETADWQALTGEALACRNCHGDVSEHLRDAGRGPVFAFRDEPAIERNARCLACHGDSHPTFDRSPHARAGLTCTSCHEQYGEHAATALLRVPTLDSKPARRSRSRRRSSSQ
jgi:hypothetical protein